ncbi:MAG: Gfo/Idh/MocA family oxidoreductase [Acidimicrobiales bacterium]|nr:Gfo/Idh/MocA family oxidoreductase [Acidimicrobiales bacterium]
MSAKFALGLVGCGRLAETGYVPALAATPGIRLVAVADPEPARRTHLAALAATAGVGPPSGEPLLTFPDAARLLAGAAVDGVVLATPAASHPDDAERAAAARVATLVEKPPAVDAAHAARLLAIEPAPWVGFNRRFDPDAAAVGAAVPADGDVELRLEIGYRRQGWGAHDVRDDALLDLGPHLIDWARWITGSEVVDVACTQLTFERATLDLTLGRGRGRARLRAATDRPHTELVELRNGSGDLLARHRLGGLLAAARGRLRRSRPTTLVTTLAGQLAAFADGRDDHAPTLATAADGHAAMAVVDAARTSAAAGGRRTPITSAGAH